MTACASTATVESLSAHKKHSAVRNANANSTSGNQQGNTSALTRNVYDTTEDYNGEATQTNR